ncbi:hypothetical protein Acife_1955 [Acidithiobacillus ferrivorans SS3]|uniref:Uncharacterized protein n=1 Tax=Acidithiobacillus ferrivorans SS3 TaxID=743299 RepID=G0JLM9_9PROT|nr:hypothetical protein [Acidithiobacillus ferrivorans]AEM48078.1 hypothetical protein Acife_1955 [Acidithiobacillus ferrivorans SS3]
MSNNLGATSSATIDFPFSETLINAALDHFMLNNKKLNDLQVVAKIKIEANSALLSFSMRKIGIKVRGSIEIPVRSFILDQQNSMLNLNLWRPAKITGTNFIGQIAIALTKLYSNIAHLKSFMDFISSSQDDIKLTTENIKVNISDSGLDAIFSKVYIKRDAIVGGRCVPGCLIISVQQS